MEVITKKATVSIEEAALLVLESGLLGSKADAMQQFQDLMAEFASATACGQTTEAFWEGYIIDPFVQQPRLTEWTAESWAQWGLVIATNINNLAAYPALVKEVTYRIVTFSNHPDIYPDPHVCALFAALADAYKLRIVPRVYGQGHDTVTAA